MDEIDGMNEVIWVLLVLEWRFSYFSLLLSCSHILACQFHVTFETITTSENRPLVGQDDLLAGRLGMLAGRQGPDRTTSLLLQSFTLLYNNHQ